MDKEQNIIKTNNLIIGAGLSGLSFALFSKKDYLILEQDSTPGGYCRTIPHPKFVWDYAGHFYHFRNEKYKKLFLSLVEPEEIIEQKKNTIIFYKDRKIDYPFQANIHELEKDEFIECLHDLYFREKDAKYNDFLEMLYAKFGKAITEKFLRPYNEKLYATDLHNLDKEAMGRFFPYVDFDAVMKSMGHIAKETYNDNFLYLKKGTGYFIDKLYAQLDKSKVLLNEEVISIDLENKTVRTKIGKTIQYNHLINTAPFNHFVDLFGNKDLEQISRSLSYNKVLVLNLGFDKPSTKFQTEHWVYFPDKALNFYRIGFYNNILGEKDLNVYVEIGFPKDAATIDADKELAKAIDGMKAVGIIDDSTKLVDKSIIMMDPAYVHISTKDDQTVQNLLKSFEDKNIYSLGRYGRWTYNCMEDCMALADELAKRIND